MTKSKVSEGGDSTLPYSSKIRYSLTRLQLTSRAIYTYYPQWSATI